MDQRKISKLRRETNSIVATLAAIAILLVFVQPGGGRPVTGMAVAALAVPMLTAAIYYNSEARRLSRGAGPHSGTRTLLRIGQVVCLVLIVAAAADLIGQWNGLETSTAVASAILIGTAVAAYCGYFHRRFTRTDTGRLRFAQTPISRALTARRPHS